MRAATLFALAGLLHGAVCASAGAGESAPPAIVIADFENESDRGLVRTRKPAMISHDISSRGRSSLKMQSGDYISIRTERLGHGRRGDLLNISLFNAGSAPQQVRAEVFDDTSLKGYWYRHVRHYALRPGWNTLRFEIARLYRGEKSTKKITHSYLDPSRINRIDLAFRAGQGLGAIYMDHLRFEPDPPMPEADGLLAFDFGPENQAPRCGFTRSSREIYDPERGHGWSSPGWPRAVRDYTHPNSLLSDFREAKGETFSVKVPNGAYRVRVYYEDHGWWSDQIVRFSWRTITAEGKVVHEERPTRDQAAKSFYRFADIEPRPTTDVYDTYIKNGRYKPKEFAVNVEDGKLDIRFDADRPWASRISAIVLWPAAQAEAAAEWCAELDRRMHEEFDAENVYIDTSPRGRHDSDIPEGARQGGLVVFSAGGTEPTGPSYVPAKTELISAVKLVCVPGEDSGASFSLRATQADGLVKIAAEVPNLAAKLLAVQNRIQRHGGGYTIVPDILRPADNVAIAAGETRQFWLEIAVPPDTKPATYTGEITIEFREQKRTLPVSVEVLPIKLSEPKMAFGLFGLLPDSYTPPGAARQVVELLKRHGMSSVSGVPLGRVRAKDGSIRIDFTQADEVMALLKKAGFKHAVDTYGGGLVGLKDAAGKLGVPYPEALRQAMALLRRHADVMDWLPVSYSVVDEPQWSDDAVRRATEGVGRLRAAAPWLLTNGYWSPSAGNEVHRGLMDALGRTSMSHVTPEAVRYLKAQGRSIGFYGLCSRHEFGLRQWAAAAEGFEAHYAWHSYIRYGDLYYDLDAREPDVCMIYYTPTAVRPSLRLKSVRAGAYDFLYLQTLADLLAKARPGPAAEEAKALLDRAREAGNVYQTRSAPRITGLGAFRRKVANAILKLAQGEKK